MALTPFELVLIVGPTLMGVGVLQIAFAKVIARGLTQALGKIANQASEAAGKLLTAAPESANTTASPERFSEMGKLSGQSRAIQSFISELAPEINPGDPISMILAKNPKLRSLAQKYPFLIPLAQNFLSKYSGQGGGNGKTLNTGQENYWMT